MLKALFFQVRLVEGETSSAIALTSHQGICTENVVNTLIQSPQIYLGVEKRPKIGKYIVFVI